MARYMHYLDEDVLMMARNPQRWAEYVRAIEAGYYFKLPGLAFQRFAQLFLGAAIPKEREVWLGAPRIALRDISNNVYNPNANGFQYWSPVDKALNEGGLKKQKQLL